MKWKPSVTHRSCEAGGMIPGESLRSVLGEGTPETERVPGGYHRHRERAHYVPFASLKDICLD